MNCHVETPILYNQNFVISLEDFHRIALAEKFGESREIGKAVKKREWNKYRITGKGFHFVHYINGVKTTELIDNDEGSRRKDGLLALQLHAGPPMKVSFRNFVLK